MFLTFFKKCVPLSFSFQTDLGAELSFRRLLYREVSETLRPLKSVINECSVISMYMFCLFCFYYYWILSIGLILSGCGARGNGTTRTRCKSCRGSGGMLSQVILKIIVCFKTYFLCL